MMGEYGEKAAKCYLWSEGPCSPPWEGGTTHTHNSVSTLQVFKCTYVVVLQKLYLGKFNAKNFEFRTRTTKTINENEGN